MWLQMSYSEHGAELPCTVKFFFKKKLAGGLSLIRVAYDGSKIGKQG
jgi:hypothetical protein